MASAIEIGCDKTEYSFLTCTLCNDELRKPKLLPCQHTFCTQCLVQLHNDDGDDDKRKPFYCPTCQRDIGLGDDTVESVPDNYVFEIVKGADGNELNLKCIPCSQGEKNTTATHKCLDCGDTLCQHCNEWHCRFTISRHHVVYPIKDLQKGKIQEEFAKKKVKYCGLHSKDDLKVPLSSYCDTCRCLVCLDCIQGDHNEHSFLKIHDARESRQRSYDDKLYNLQRSKRDQEKRIENISEAITDTEQRWSQQETYIYDTATQIYAMVDRIKDEKLTELKVQYERELQYLNDLLVQEKNKLSCLKGTVSFTNMFLEKSPDSDFIFHEDDIEARIERSQQGKRVSFTRNMVTTGKQEKESITEAIEGVLGRIVIQEEVVTHTWKIGEVKERFRKNIKMDAIKGLALNINDIFVAGLGKDEGIMVLNECGNYSRTIECDDAIHSCDIDVTSDRLFLTVYNLPDYRDREVKLLDFDGKLIKSVQIPEYSQESDERMGIVIDNEGTMFVSSYAMNKIFKLNRHEETFSTLLEWGPYHSHTYADVCLTPTGELVLSNVLFSNIDIFSKEGELLWQYDGQQEGYELVHPSGVCCDEDGYIYVADKGNCRIQVIRDRKWVGNIPIHKEAKESGCVSLQITPDRELIYAYDNYIVKIAFWEIE